MGLFGLNTESICFGDKSCIAQREARLKESDANANALNAIAANSGKGQYMNVIIISIISVTVIIIVGSVLYLKTKNKI